MEFRDISSMKPAEIRQELEELATKEVELRGVRANAEEHSMGEIAQAGTDLKEVKERKHNLENSLAAAGLTEEEKEEVTEEEETVEEPTAETSEETPAEEEAPVEETTAEETTEETVAETTEETPVEETTTEAPVAEDEPVEEVETEESVEEKATSSSEGTAEEDSVEENGENIVADDINTPTEATENVARIAAEFRPVVDGAKNTVEAVQKVKVKTNGGEAFKRIIHSDNKFVAANHTAEQTTDFLMGLGTPDRDGELSFSQKQYFSQKHGSDKVADKSVAAAFCQPAERIDSAIQCGSYERRIAARFPKFILEGLAIEYFNKIDSDDPDFVGWVDLEDSSINKSCMTAGCIDKTELEAEEIKGCLQSNEQTAFTNAAGIRALLADGEALIAAMADERILEKINEETYKFGYAGTGAGYGEVKVAVATAKEALNRQSKIYNVDNLEAFVPASFLDYHVGDQAVRQFALSELDDIASGLFGGLGIRNVTVYDDALDVTNDAPVPALSRVDDTALTPRTDWAIHLVDPADGFLGIRDENDYTLQPVAQSIAEKRANRLSWFARAYELFGRRGCSPWATINLTNLCLGGRVIASATCIGASED